MGQMIFYEREYEKFEYNTYTKGSVFSDVTDEDLIATLDVLTQLGIIKEDESGLYRPDIPATRGQFAQAVYRMCVDEVEDDTPVLDGGETAAIVATSFEDVAGDSEYAAAIAYLSEQGIMNGTAEAKFQPNIYINYLDAITVLVRVLGLKDIAENNGGYPNGYIKTATKEKIISGSIAYEEYLRRDDMAFLLENVVRAEYLEPEIFRNDGYVTYIRKEGALGLTKGVYCGTGIVRVTPLTRLTVPGSDLDFNQVKIGDFEYYLGGTKAASMIGAEVDYWYTEDDGVRTLRAVVPSGSTEFTLLDSAKDTITSISNSEIVYTKSGEDEEETFEIENDTAIIYNGVAIDKELTEIVDNENSFKGFINIVENSDRSTAVIIEEYMDLTIETVDYSSNEIIAAKTEAEKTADAENIRVALDETQNYVILKDKLGSDLKINQFRSGDIITVYQSKNDGKKLVRVFAAEGYVDGTIDKIDPDGNIYIDGKVYNFSNRYEGPKDVGLNRRFYFNYYGDIYTSEPLDGIPQVGLYFGNAHINDGIEESAEIKIMTSDSKSVLFPISKRATVDGQKFDSLTDIVKGSGTWVGLEDLALETPIRYRVNSKGEISMLDTPGVATDDPDNTLIRLPGNYKQLYYFSTMSCISDENYKTLFYCPSTSVAFAFYASVGAPADERERYCVAGKVGKVLNVTGWQATGGAYSTTGDPRVADIIIDDDKNAEYEAAAPLVVDEVTTKLDSNKELINIIKGVSASGTVEYILSDDFMNSLHGGIKVGDIINSLERGDVVSFKVLSGNTPRVFDRIIMYRDLKPSHTFTSVEGKDVAVSAYVYPGNQSVGANSKYSTAAFKYGTIKEKTGDYILIDTGGSEYELISYGGVPVTEVYRREEGAEFIKTNQSTAMLEVGSEVLVYLLNKVNQIVVYNGF